jgi:dihydropyrimidinase
MAIVLKGGTVVSASGRKQLDIRIDGEKIVEVGENLNCDGCEVEDVSGYFLLPGFIDAHTHLELNNGAGSLGTADNFYTGSKAAVAKGTTTVVDMATPNRDGTLKECFDSWTKMAEGNSSCDYNYHMAIIQWTPKIKEEIKEIIAAGTTSFKMYMAYENLRTPDSAIFEVIEELKKHGGMLGVHCENGDLVEEAINRHKEAGLLTPHYFPKTRPVSVEAEAVERYLTIAEMADYPVNIVHLSAKRSLESVRRARKRGQTVYVETCPHYLVLDESVYDLPGFEGGKYICSPPVRTLEDQEALWEGIINGEINTVSTDHCSFNFHTQKILGKDDFSLAPSGLPGVEDRPILLHTAGVASGKITLERMVGLLAEDVAKQFKFYPQKGVLQVGSDADIVIWDPEATGVITAKTQLQNVDYNPYEGFETVGAAKGVYLRGKKVAEDGRVILEKTGKFAFRKA